MKKWIAPFGEETESRKKEYLITDIGKQMARKEINRMAEVLRLASTIIGGEKSK